MAEEVSLALHRKYRPYNLNGYLGNAENKKKIVQALKSENKPQVIMLSGASGCGKTTLARIIAKEYTCPHREATNCSCNVCEYCKSAINFIRTGVRDSYSNIKEIDITEQSGKNDLADVLEDMNVPTFENEWKVYILDEVHMASNALQNRLLKIAEEPPQRVLLIFCTTRPDKIIDTLKNRCQLSLTVEKPTDSDLGGYLEFICVQEKIDYDNRGLSLIMRHSNYVTRTAVITLEQAINDKNSAKYEDIIDTYKEVSTNDFVDLMIALKTKDSFKYITVLNKIKSKVDFPIFLEQFKSFVCKGIYMINSVTQRDVTEDEIGSLKKVFADLSTEQISVLLDKLLHMDKNDIELELITLGYTGLVLPKAPTETVYVKQIADEQGLEKATANSEVKKKQDEENKQAIVDIKKSTAPITEDILMSMGATLVSG